MMLKGFTAGGSLIFAIGAQNVFVLRQGLLRHHLLLTALLCSFIDALLIILGVAGFGKILSCHPALIDISKYGAVGFLFLYGILSLKSAFKPKALKISENIPLPSAKKTILLIMLLSLLNPHVYVDTVILLGSIAAQHSNEEKMYFTLGAISASFVWFFAMTYGSRLLAPVLSSPRAWKRVDCGIAFTMWGIAFVLLTH
ncbi:MAG: Arginine exporter protein ArgO [Chlamydiales bacterium]|nr:Arginine exporter protein ArgO [Chlamydiales bacterium]